MVYLIEFKVMVASLGKRISEHSVNFNEVMKNLRKYQTEVTKVKNTRIQWKNTPGDSIAD